MNPKKYVRLEPDGVHWPDADVRDNLYYGIDFNACINVAEGEEITAVEWVLEVPGLVSTDDFLQDNIVSIKIETLEIGTFKALCLLTTFLSGKTETQAAPMMLTVY
jgi:hypothetical protein